MPYDVGDTWLIEATFTDDDGDPVEPDSVTITIEAPDGTQTTPAVTLTTNVATASAELTQPGYWHAIIDPAGIEGIEAAWVYATALPFTPDA